MDSLEYILFICIAVPLLMMTLLLKGRSRQLLGFMLIGILVCLFTSELNSLLLALFDNDILYMTTVITPIIEELSKMLPILVFALLFENKLETLFVIGLSLGIGFGFFENTIILVQNIENVSITWALIRGFATALMHGICTLSVGLGISFVRKKRKLFYPGLFSLLAMTAVYHGIFNMLQIRYQYVGLILPIITYIPLVIMQIVIAKKAKKNGGEEETEPPASDRPQAEI